MCSAISARFIFFLLISPLFLHAQQERSLPTSTSFPELAEFPEPMPGDVLTPDTRGNSPNIKVAFKLGINRAAYTNDRFIDNRPFDVGLVFGEADVYGAAAGFGSQVGVEVELPQNTIFSWALSARLDHVVFDNGGTVNDFCLSPRGDTIGENSEHMFEATIDYLKIVGAAKLNFQQFYVVAGLAIETPLQNEVLFTRTHDGQPCFYPEARDIRNSPRPVPIPEINALHVAMRIGGGLNYRISERLQFSPELTLDFGMNALNKSPESDLGTYAVSAVFRYDI